MARAARNTRNTNERIIESGVTHHISPNLMDFHEYHPLEESCQVESADSVSLQQPLAASTFSSIVEYSSGWKLYMYHASEPPCSQYPS